MSWKIRTLNSVASVFNGKTPSRSEQRELGHPVLKIKDIDASRNFSGLFESYVDENLAEKFEDKKLQLHDSLILNAAHNSDYVGSKQYRAEQTVVGSLPTGEWLIVRANQNELDAKFLNYWLSTPNAKYQIKQLVKGIHLYPKDVARLQIPIPPMPEQKRISVILDKADSIHRKRQQAINLAYEFLRAIFLDMFGDPLKWDMSNPYLNWEVKPVGKICLLKRGYDLPVQDRLEGIYPIYAANGVVGKHSNYMAKGPGVITGRSGTLGKVIFTKEDYWPLNTSLYVKDFFENEPKYIEWYLRLFQLDRYHRGAGVPTLNRNLFLQELSLRPPLTLQAEFVKKIDKAEVLISKMTMGLGSQIFEVLSQKAFLGEL